MNKLAVIQMSSTLDVEDNLRTANHLLRRASQLKASVAILPECFAFMGRSLHEQKNIAENYGKGRIQDTMASIAKRLKMWIVAGTIPIKQADGDKIWFTTLVFDEFGEIVARYHKIHLFDVTINDKEQYDESSIATRGYEPVCIRSPVGVLGLSICYDLRFPELYRRLVSMGAEVLVVPAAFTYVTGKAHWEILLRARAIENLCYVAAANQTGDHASGRRTYGHSMIVSPWGHIDAKLNGNFDVIISDINLEKLQEKRNSFPCLTHRLL